MKKYDLIPTFTELDTFIARQEHQYWMILQNSITFRDKGKCFWKIFGVVRG